MAFKETIETEERGETVIYIITESVSPLTQTIRTLGLNGPQREQYLSMGLNQVVSALSFLNNDCKLIHGNVCSAAIVVTDALDWKLHGFDLVTESAWQGGMGVEVPLTAASWMVAAQYKPGEVAKSDWEAVRGGPAWAVDAWGLGCFIQEIYSGSSLARMEDLRTTDNIPQTLLPYYQRLLASAAPKRLNSAKILESGVLKSKLGDTMAFLENLALKDSMEKDTFFKRLPSSLPSIPEPVAQRKLLPLLASALEFGGAPPVALGALLTIGEGMTEEERGKQVVPILTKLFASHDRGIRRGLLENIASFGHALPASLVEEQIYPNVQSGFGDSNPYLRELTLKSMVVLGPKISAKTLNQSLLKHLAKLQVDEEPAIRANTTVLLGNLAPQMADGTRKKVLLNAFTRALKDPFPPARAAGLRAVLATNEYHSAEDIAARAIPMIGPLCIDPVQEVRASALQCLEKFLTALQKHSRELDVKAEAAGASAAASGGIGSSSAGAGGAGSSLLTGFGWAVSSLVSKAGPGEGGPPVTTAAASASSGINGINGNSTYASPAKPLPSSGPASSSQSSLGVHHHSVSSRSDDWEPSRGNTAAPPKSVAAPSAPAAAMSGGDGWGDDDDDPLEDMVDSVAAEMEARQKLSRVGLGSKPAGGGGSRPASGRTIGGGGAGARTAAGGAGARVGAGKGMKLGVKKLAKDESEEFADW